MYSIVHFSVAAVTDQRLLCFQHCSSNFLRFRAYHKKAGRPNFCHIYVRIPGFSAWKSVRDIRRDVSVTNITRVPRDLDVHIKSLSVFLCRLSFISLFFSYSLYLIITQELIIAEE